ncbi:MAG: ABC transporter permease [Propionibacterium sp.]|nr:ABC transporter permease [Propionibacterium sp.]
MTTQITHSRLRLSVRVLAPLVFGAVVLLAWHLASASGAVAPSLLPPPGEVFARFATDVASGALPAYAGVTLLEALLGCVLAAVVGLPLGYLIARARVAEAAVSPYLAASQAIPAVAIAPLLVIWVGYGLVPIMLLCALLVFFPVVLSTVLGLRSVDREMLEAARLDGAHGWTMLRHIEWPLALPAILTGLRNGFTLSVTGAVVGEFVMGGHGLGMVLSVQAMSVDTTGLFATLLMLCLIAVGIYLAMLVLEWRTDPLRPVSAARAVPTAEPEPAPQVVPVPLRPVDRPAPVTVLGRAELGRATARSGYRFESGAA